MFNMDLHNVICPLFRQHQSSEQRGLAMVMSFDCRLYDHDVSRNGEAVSLHFLMYSPYGRSVHTYVAKDGNPFQRPNVFDMSRWENISNHDTCWREAISGFVYKQTMEMSDALNMERKGAKLESKAPIDFGMLVGFQDYKFAYRLASVSQERDPDLPYHYKLTAIKFCEG